MKKNIYLSYPNIGGVRAYSRNEEEDQISVEMNTKDFTVIPMDHMDFIWKDFLLLQFAKENILQLHFVLFSSV